MRSTSSVLTRASALLVAFALLGAACGGGGDSDELACDVGTSEFGPLREQLGMSEEAAEQFMIDNQIGGWIEVSASGSWQPLWDESFDQLGAQIHSPSGVTWIDVEVAIDGLPDDAPDVVPVRVSRSYQGKIETASIPAWEPVGFDPDDIDTSCAVERVILGDQEHPEWLDLTEFAVEP